MSSIYGIFSFLCTSARLHLPRGKDSVSCTRFSNGSFMNTERLLLRRKLIDFLYATCPDLTEALKSTRHVYPGTQGPYHREDSVWSHTLLVLQSALEQEDYGMEHILCALVHDFAKPHTAVVRPAKQGPGKRYSFHEHGPKGTQAAVDFLTALRHSWPDVVTDGEIARIAACVSSHIAFYDLDNARDALRFCNGDTLYCASLLRLLYCDNQGSILDPETPTFAKNQKLLESTRALLATLPEQTQGEELTRGPGLHLVCGPNAQARRIFCEQASQGRIILDCPPADATGARDECLVTTREGFPGRHQELIRKTAGEGLFISGTLCSRRPRRSLANILHDMVPEAPITCTFVLSPSEAPWIPEVPKPSARDGLPHPVPSLTMPCMLHEPRLAGTRIVLVCPR